MIVYSRAVVYQWIIEICIIIFDKLTKKFEFLPLLLFNFIYIKILLYDYHYIFHHILFTELTICILSFYWILWVCMMRIVRIMGIYWLLFTFSIHWWIIGCLTISCWFIILRTTFSTLFCSSITVILPNIDKLIKITLIWLNTR